MEKITEQCDEYDLNFLREAAKLLSTSPLSKGGNFSCSFAFFPVDQDTPIFSSSFLYIIFFSKWLACVFHMVAITINTSLYLLTSNYYYYYYFEGELASILHRYPSIPIRLIVHNKKREISQRLFVIIFCVLVCWPHDLGGDRIKHVRSLLNCSNYLYTYEYPEK